MSESQGIEQLLRQQFGERCRDVALAAGEALFAQGDAADALYLVTEGRLRVVQTCADGGQVVLASLRPGDLVGELGILTGGERTASVAAEEASRLLRLGREDVETLLTSAPAIAARLADLARERLRRSQLAEALRRLLGRVEPAVFEDVERSVSYVSLRGGEVLVREGETDRSLYILLSGRLRVERPSTGSDRPGPAEGRSEIAPGESVGEIALLTGEPRTAKVRALRDSLLARLSPEAFDALSARHPELLAALARVVIRRLRARERVEPAAPRAMSLALLPANPGVPLDDVARRLAAALSRLGPTLHLSREAFERSTGLRGAADIEPGAPRSGWLAAWIGEQEARYTFLLFQADLKPSPWTHRCVRQADRLLLAARAEDSPSDCGSRVANWGLSAETRDPKSATAKPFALVLLHPRDSALPSGTRAWLDAVPVAEHFHVRAGADGDFGRLARCVAGRAVGLALGGGGARGLAHLGVIRALLESGVPVDRVAGTSMGAIIGAAAAMEMDYETELANGRRTFIEGKPHKEYTLPLFSLVRGRRLNRHLGLIYGDTCIEDLWRTFLCVSCNLTTTEMVVHTRGLVWKAVRASLAIPGIFTPVVRNGELLVDGGVLNNLPGDLLRAAGCSRVVVVDVSPPLDLAIGCEEFPSPWRRLWRRLWRREPTPHVPSVVDILMRTVVISSEQKVREIERDADLCLTPPVTHYGMLQFDAMHAIADAGHAYTKQVLSRPDRPAWLNDFLDRPQT